MSCVQYAWGGLPPCIFPGQTKISPGVSPELNVSGLAVHDMSHYPQPENAESAKSTDGSIIVPKPRELLFEHLEISHLKCLACGHHSVVFVNENGHIFVYKGSNNSPSGHTKIGRGIDMIDSLSAHKITSVSCGKRHTVALTSTGQVYTWGDNTYGQLGQDPELMKHSESPLVLEHSTCSPEHTAAVQISCGTNFNIILTETGDLYSWGENKCGQLGLGTECEFQWSPQHLATLRGLCIVQTSCGENHSLCLTISGSVFGWGGNQYGQLGGGITDDTHWPRKLKTLQHQKITTIACGDKHSVALSKDGKIYTFGNGEHGQLGHNSTKNETLPKVVMDLMGDIVTHVACGRAHTIVNVRSTNREVDFIYSFGSGTNGQLGHGELTDTIQPVRLAGISTPINLTKYTNTDTLVVDTLVAGGDQSYVRFAPKNDVDHVNQMANSQPLLLTHQIVQNYSDVISRSQLKKIISSANCMNGSFLSGDQHYSCTTKCHGVDLQLAENVFTKLDEISDMSLRKEITDLIAEHLIPSFKDSPPDIESMRLYLTLPFSHPFQYPGNVGDILAPFAQKVLELKDMPTKIINKWWAAIPCRNFIWIKNIYQQAITYIVHNPDEVATDENTARKHLICCVKILNRLYEINEERDTTVPYAEFYISGLHEKVKLALDAAIKISMDHAFMEKQFVFCDYPFMFDMTAKSYLLKATSNLQKQVIFDGEEGIDDGGPTKEFFLLLQDQLLSPEYGISEENENSHLIWFKSEPQSEKWNMIVHALNGINAHEVLGTFCSLAIYNNVIVDFHFPTALYKKLLNKPLSLNDLVEFDPDYNSFYRLLDMPEDDVEYLEQYFEMNVGKSKTIELIPNGSKIQVTAANRKDYVERYVDYILNKSVKEEFEKFQQGFLSVFAKVFLQLFRPEEIQELVIGNTKYEWDTLKEMCEYENVYNPDHETIKYFWEVFMEFEEEEKRKFLLFLTGSSRIPIAGMKAVTMCIVPSDEGEDFLPWTHTCYNLLHLPVYTSKKVLKEKLSMAICVTGFGLE